MSHICLNKNSSFAYRKFAWLHVKGFAIGILIIWLLGVWPAVVVTPSINKTLFMVNKYSKIFPKGSYVYFKSARPGSNTVYPIIKQVVGIAGDVIEIKNNKCLVEGRLVGTIKSTGNNGVKLTGIASGVIPAGKLFVAGNIDNSFDSRYQELVLLNKDEVKRAYLVF